MLIGFALFAVALMAVTRTDAVIPAFVALGIVGVRWTDHELARARPYPAGAGYRYGNPLRWPGMG